MAVMAFQFVAVPMPPLTRGSDLMIGVLTG
jgi:hypothetical protein